MKVVILCGGKGERMGKISHTVPKPLISIGDKPVLWHIMKSYAHRGFNEFVLCTGYKGDKIREYFSTGHNDWNIEFVDTGLDAKKSERLAKAEKFIDTKNFFLSYGDDLCDVDMNNVMAEHQKSGKIVTLTAVRLLSPFGLLEMSDDGTIVEFHEKPLLDKWINGGYMAIKNNIFDHLEHGELEDDVFKKLAEIREIGSYRHFGNWKSMNTLKDNTELNNLWENNRAFWKVW